MMTTNGADAMTAPIFTTLATLFAGATSRRELEIALRATTVEDTDALARAYVADVEALTGGAHTGGRRMLRRALGSVIRSLRAQGVAGMDTMAATRAAHLETFLATVRAVDR